MIEGMIVEVNYETRKKLVEVYVDPMESNEKVVKEFNMCGEHFGVKCENTSAYNQEGAMCQNHIDAFYN